MSRQERSGARRYRPHEGTAVGRKVADQATLAAWVVPGIEPPAPTVEGRATVTGGDAIKIGRHGMDVPAKTGSAGRMRSEERRVGKGGVRTGRSRWSPYN